MSNAYSADWFDTFLSASDPPSVHRELAFVQTHLPLPDFRRILDVPCGIGRHARAFAEVGYEVVGVDISAEALAKARDGAPPETTFLHHDMRDLDDLDSDFDAVVCLWQSFGWSSDDGNRAVLASMARRLRPGGRLLLDVYNRDGLPSLAARDLEVRHDREVLTRRSLADDRFRVAISYDGSGVRDEFEWQVFTPTELIKAAAGCELAPVLTCAWFDDQTPPGPEHVRMQLLLQREADRTGRVVAGASERPARDVRMT